MTIIKDKNIRKFLSFNSIYLVFTIILGILSSKIIAISIGPSGMAIVGNFRQFFQSLESAVILGINQGMIHKVSKYENQFSRIISTAFILLMFTTIFAILILLIGQNYFYINILNETISTKHCLVILAILIPFIVGSHFVLSIANGKQEHQKILKIQILSIFISFLISAIFIYQFKIIGALISVFTYPVVLFFVGCIYLKFPFSKINIHLFDKKIAYRYSNYALMTIVTAILSMLIGIYIRNMIISQASIQQAGYYEAIQRISSNYSLFYITAINLFYFSKLSKAKSKTIINGIIVNYLKNIVSLFFIGLCLIFIFKKYIIKILFTENFIEMDNLFFWQLLYDFIKSITTIFGIWLIIQQRIKLFLITEILSFGLLLLFSKYFFSIKSTQGVLMGQSLSLSIYLVILLLIYKFYKPNFSTKDLNT